MEGFYIFKVFKDLQLIFVIQNFASFFKATKLTDFKFFYSRKFHTISLFYFRSSQTQTSTTSPHFTAPTTGEITLRNSISTHTHKIVVDFQESKTLKCQSLVSALKLRRNCTDPAHCFACKSYYNLYKGAEMSSEHYFKAAHFCTLPGKKHLLH